MSFWNRKPDPYREYLSLQSKLSALIATGEDESSQGDELRDAMGKLWRKLTAEQKRILNKDVDFPEVPGSISHGS